MNQLQTIKDIKADLLRELTGSVEASAFIIPPGFVRFLLPNPTAPDEIQIMEIDQMQRNQQGDLVASCIRFTNGLRRLGRTEVPAKDIPVEDLGNLLALLSNPDGEPKWFCMQAEVRCEGAQLQYGDVWALTTRPSEAVRLAREHVEEKWATTDSRIDYQIVIDPPSETDSDEVPTHPKTTTHDGNVVSNG